MQVEIFGVRDAVISKTLQSELPESARAFTAATLGAMEQRPGRALRVRVRTHVAEGEEQRTRFSVEIDEFDAKNLIGKTDREAL